MAYYHIIVSKKRRFLGVVRAWVCRNGSEEGIFTPDDQIGAVFVGRRNLPHLRQEGAVYYLTFRLFDSVAGEKLREWQHELESLPKEQHKTHTARRMEKWLDLGHGSFAEMAGL